MTPHDLLEAFDTLADAPDGVRALRSCRYEYGMRRHSTTGRILREHSTHVEAPELLPLPGEPYDVPHWSTGVAPRWVAEARSCAAVQSVHRSGFDAPLDHQPAGGTTLA